MELRHAGHPRRAVRLAYCLNLHAGDSAADVQAGLAEVTLPLRRRLADGRPFGVGMYASAAAVAELGPGSAARARLAGFLREHGLEPFTWNAFPYGRFHEPGLKQRVFEPTWSDPLRLGYTADVADLASELSGAPSAGRHLSISTHTGMHASRVAEDDPEMAVHAQVAFAAGLAGLELERGWRVVLGLEAEPRANCNDTAELARWRGEAAARFQGELEPLLARHLGTCLDACHAAVEFEDPGSAWANATAHRAPLAKLQFTSALALRDPARDGAARARLLAQDEPVFLHQVTGRAPGGALVRAGDLPELARALEEEPEPWLACGEWRCHFHVPVDLAEAGGGLGTTRACADALLERALADPRSWGTDELHVEIETYTWQVLAGARAQPRSAAALVDGLEAEYRHVLGRLERSGWRPA
jgi:hypothetical protein